MDKKMLIISISMMSAFNFSILSSLVGIEIPLARQISGLLVLTFLPGYLLLKITEERNKSPSEIIFFSIALSVAIVLITGTTINFVLPRLGVNKPLSIIPLWVTFNILMTLLVLVSYLKKRSQYFSELNLITKYKSFTKIDLFFSLLPVLSLLSAYIFNFYINNIGLLVLYVIIGMTSIIFANSERLNFNTTYAIWCVGMSLLFSTVFGVSWNYIWGWDITGEYYLAHNVIEKGIWEISLYEQYNTVASVNILAPIYSILLNIDLIWVFKIVYPLIFSLVPVILFKAYEIFLRSKTYASLAALYFMFNVTFFTEMMSLARQMIAEIYLALLVYILLKETNRLFLLLSTIALAISHYSTAYLTMFALLPIPIAYIIMQRINIVAYLKISPRYVAFLVIFTILWYSYVGRGFQFDNLITIIYETIIYLQDILNPYSSQGLYFLVSERTTLIQQFVKFVGLTAQLFIIIGVISLSINMIKLLEKEKIEIQYFEFYIASLVFFVYDIFGVILPFFSNRLNMTRLYHITLFFISPYLLVGFLQVTRLISKGFELLHNTQKFKGIPAKTFLGLFIVVYFLSTSGWLYTVTGDRELYFLDKKADQAYWSLGEVYGAKWIEEHKKHDLIVYSDVYRALLIRAITGQNYNWGSINGEQEDMEVYIPKKGYLYLGERNLREKVLVVKDWDFMGTVKYYFEVSLDDPTFIKLRSSSPKIYSGNVTIYIILNS